MLFDVLVEVVGSVEVALVLPDVILAFVEVVVATLAVLEETVAAAVLAAHPNLESIVL